MLAVGLTGGIATGKSAVLQMLAERGASVLSADAIVHDLLDNDADIQQRIVAEFGPGCRGETGGLDRASLAQIVFSDPRRRRDLEGILHPAVISRMVDWLRCERERQAPVAVVEVPLLFEANLQAMFDVTVVVASEHAVQAYRLKNRGLSPQQAAARISAQMPLAAKEELAGFVLRNDGSLDDLREQVRALWDTLLARGTPSSTEAAGLVSDFPAEC